MLTEKVVKYKEPRIRSTGEHQNSRNRRVLRMKFEERKLQVK